MAELTQTVVIAGAGPGLGAAIARAFARESYGVALMARDAGRLERIAADARTEGAPEVKGYSVDLADPAAIPPAFAAARADLGDPSVLVYNASLWREADTQTLDPDLFHRDLGLSVTGALVAAQAVWPAMKAAGRGTIILTGGGLALHPEFGARVVSLTAGKSAMRGLALALAPELAGDGIHGATITVAGTIQPGTAFAPDRIASHYVRVTNEPKGAWTTEYVFRGE